MLPIFQMMETQIPTMIYKPEGDHSSPLLLTAPQSQSPSSSFSPFRSPFIQAVPSVWNSTSLHSLLHLVQPQLFFGSHLQAHIRRSNCPKLSQDHKLSCNIVLIFFEALSSVISTKTPLIRDKIHF